MLNDVFKLSNLLTTDQVQLFPKFLIFRDKLLYLVHLLVKQLKLRVSQYNSCRELFVDLIDLNKLFVQ